MSKGRGCLGGLMFLILSGQLGCWGIAILLVVLGLAIYYLLPIAYDVFRALLAIGVLFGAGITVRNYALALYHNIKPEKATP
jgi:NADH:ubiquinone oxidoreductase subunit 3 (subunit A)